MKTPSDKLRIAEKYNCITGFNSMAHRRIRIYKDEYIFPNTHFIELTEDDKFIYTFQCGNSKEIEELAKSIGYIPYSVDKVNRMVFYEAKNKEVRATKKLIKLFLKLM